MTAETSAASTSNFRAASMMISLYFDWKSGWLLLAVTPRALREHAALLDDLLHFFDDLGA